MAPGDGVAACRRTASYRLLLGLALVLLSGWVLLGTSTAEAQGDDDSDSSTEQTLHGVIELDDDPVPGVTLRVETPDGAEVGESTTAEDGTWQVELPEGGEYVVTIDDTTLSEGVELRDPERTSTEIRVSPGRDRQVLFPLGEGAQRTSALDAFAQRALLGVKFGLLVGMMAVGLSLIFGTTGIINFAHGELVAMGAVFTWILNGPVGLHLLIAAPIGIVAVAAFAGGLERFGFRRLRRRKLGLIQFLIVTIGITLIIQHVTVLVFGNEFRQYAQYARETARDFGPFSLSIRDGILMVLSVLILVGVGLFLLKARTGKALRAVADNRQLAESSGIDVDRIQALVWMIGGGLAATSGVFLGLFHNVQYLMGFRFLLLMFAAVVLGGLGAPFGAMFGGLLVGFVSEISTLWLHTELKNAWALLVLIVVLLIRPQGLFGRRERVG